MNLNTRLALCGAVVALLIAPASVALATGDASVTVRVEGLTHTLLAPTVVRTHSGSITKGGASRGKCPATSAQGALDVATRQDWSGKWYVSYDEYLITSILGEGYRSNSPDYWSVWINDRFAQVGACEIKLHNRDQVLFAVEGAKTAFPLGLSGSSSAHAGQSFTVKVVWFNTAGKSEPLSRVQVTGGGLSATTNGRGIATLTPRVAGTLVLDAAHSGYIRAAPLDVRVSG